MNNYIEQLSNISKKDERLIVGLMSGTSLDGLDIALCRFSKNGINTKVTLLNFETIPYNNFFKKEVKTIFSKREIDLEKLCLLNAFIGSEHGNMINESLKKWNIANTEVDLIASHGQTIYHAPKILHQQQEYNNATLQIGDADHIAVTTNIITISDFRQKHIAAGGQGAPLALYGDYLLFTDKLENRIMLNVGGIANFTYLPANGNTTKIICTDTGPGNTIMDAYVTKYFAPNYYDENGNFANQGNAITELLTELMNNDFFTTTFPKTTGPELFNLNYLQQALEKANNTQANKYDVMATLNLFTAHTIAQAITKNIHNESCTIYISGGGKHNTTLKKNLEYLLPNFILKNMDELGINADAKEAVLFATLANECIAGNGFAFSNIPNVNFGKISLPA